MRYLKERIQQKEVLLVPGVHDVLSSLLAEEAGFEAIGLGGLAMVASTLGKPDLGLHTLPELMTMVRNIMGEVEIPLLVDGDTGYGNALNVIRTVREIEAAGAAGIFLEDQVTPPNMSGRPVISIQEMVDKIKAALDTRRNDRFIVIARTDSTVAYGFEEGIKRGKAYEEAGADAILITRPQSLDELKTIASSFEAPTVALMIEGSPAPLLTVQELGEMGFSIVRHPFSAFMAAVSAMRRTFEELWKKGTTSAIMKDMASIQSVNTILKEGRWRELERKYVRK